jgi:hypothetical protein
MLKESLWVQLDELFRRPLLVGLLIAILWWLFMWNTNTHTVSEGSRGSDAFNSFMLFHSLVAGGLFIKLLNDCEKIQRAVIKGSKQCFQEETQLRLVWPAKLFLIAMSCLVQSTALYMHYPNAIEGLQLNAAVGFILMFFWELARILDSPMGTIWQKDSVPADWYEPLPKRV